MPWRQLNVAALLAMVVLLGFWWTRVLLARDLPPVFFAYTSLLLHASDIAMIAVLLTWPMARRLAGRPLRWGPKGLGSILLALLGLSLSSACASLDRPLTLYTSLHLAMLGGIYLYLVNEVPDRTHVAVALAALVSVEGMLAVLQFIGGTSGLGDSSPTIVASQAGASVVQTAEGVRWLRAYGTMPHPNILGGLLAASLLPLIGWYARGAGRATPLLAGALLLGMSGLVLTFSRGAWLGFACGGAMLAVRLRRVRTTDVRSRCRALLCGAALVWGVALVALPWLFYTRLYDLTGAELERRSLAGRSRQVGVAGTLLLSTSPTGVGAGNYLRAVAALSPEAPLEPVHNVPLLAAVELGPLGAVAWIGLLLTVTLSLGRGRALDGLVTGFGAGALALGVISLFDHYVWTLHPMRSMLWLWLGLWAGADREKELDTQ